MLPSDLLAWGPVLQIRQRRKRQGTIADDMHVPRWSLSAVEAIAVSTKLTIQSVRQCVRLQVLVCPNNILYCAHIICCTGTSSMLQEHVRVNACRAI